MEPEQGSNTDGTGGLIPIEANILLSGVLDTLLCSEQKDSIMDNSCGSKKAKQTYHINIFIYLLIERFNSFVCFLLHYYQMTMRTSPPETKRLFGQRTSGNSNNSVIVLWSTTPTVKVQLT